MSSKRRSPLLKPWRHNRRRGPWAGAFVLAALWLSPAAAIRAQETAASDVPPLFIEPETAGAAAQDEFVLPQKLLPIEPLEHTARKTDPFADEVAAALEQLAGGDHEARKNALDKLSLCGPAADSAVPALETLLADGQQDQTLRALAAKALWDIAKDPAGVHVLVGMLDATRPQLRPLAAYVLGHIGPAAAEALPVIARIVSSAEPLERLHLAEALARIAPEDRQAVDILLESLASSDADIRCLAAYALCDVSPIHTDVVAPALSVAQSDPEERVRTAAEMALDSYHLPARFTSGMRVAATVTRLAAQDASIEPAPQPDGGTAAEPGCRLDHVLNKDLLTTIRDEFERPIVDVGLNIAPKPPAEISAGTPQYPADYFAGCLDELAGAGYHLGYDRRFPVTSFEWAATAFCHRPLYFDEPYVERVGWHHGCCQPFASAAHFFGTIPALPYLLMAEPFHDPVYTLGQFRPGSCAPATCDCHPLSLTGASLEAAIIIGLFAAIH